MTCSSVLRLEGARMAKFKSITLLALSLVLVSGCVGAPGLAPQRNISVDSIRVHSTPGGKVTVAASVANPQDFPVCVYQGTQDDTPVLVVRLADQAWLDTGVEDLDRERSNVSEYIRIAAGETATVTMTFRYQDFPILRARDNTQLPKPVSDGSDYAVHLGILAQPCRTERVLDYVSGPMMNVLGSLSKRFQFVF